MAGTVQGARSDAEALVMMESKAGWLAGARTIFPVHTQAASGARLRPSSPSCRSWLSGRRYAAEQGMATRGIALLLWQTCACDMLIKCARSVVTRLKLQAAGDLARCATHWWRASHHQHAQRQKLSK